MENIPYDKRTGKIWYNSEMVNWTDAKVHLLNHGLHYASCVFEGERVYDVSIFKLVLSIPIDFRNFDCRFPIFFDLQNMENLDISTQNSLSP